MLEVDFFTELESSIAAMTWPSSENLIFSTVEVCLDFDMTKFSQNRLPACFIIDDGDKPYSQHDDLIEKSFTLRIVTGSVADRFGRGSLLGANRASSTSSKGAGLYHIAAQLVEQLRTITTLDSARISLKGTAKPRAGKISNNFPYLTKDYKLSARLTTKSSGSPSESTIIRSPGRVFVNPVDIEGEDYGTLLGFIRDAFLVMPDYDLRSLPLYESGTMDRLLFYQGVKLNVDVELLNWDSNTVSKAFTGSTSGDSVIFPGNLETGNDFFEDHNLQLLFVPDDLVNNNIWLFYKAAPVIVERIRIGRGFDSFLRCRFKATLDDSDRMFFAGKVSNLP